VTAVIAASVAIQRAEPTREGARRLLMGPMMA
jgi:hypothetical protein